MIFQIVCGIFIVIDLLMIRETYHLYKRAKYLEKMEKLGYKITTSE